MFLSPLTDKSAITVICDPSEAVRMMIAGVLRDIGFTRISPCATVAEARKIVREGCEWLVTGVNAAADTNALCLIEQQLYAVKGRRSLVSLLVDERERSVLPAAYERGLLSWHPRPFTKESLNREFSELLALASQPATDERLVAASYLRRHLIGCRDHKSLMRLAEGLIDQYFGRPELLVHLAEARFVSGHVDDGIAALRQAKHFDRRLERTALDLLDRYGFQDSDDLEERIGGSQTAKPPLKFKSCVIVDDDTITLAALEAAVKNLGVASVQSFNSSEAALVYLATAPKVDLIMHEWRMKGVNGPAFLQRLRAGNQKDAPVVIVSSLLTAADGPLLFEMSVANKLEKPLRADDLESALRWLEIQEKLPTDARFIERAFLSALRAKNLPESKRLITAAKAHPELTNAEKMYLEAELHFATGRLDDAQAGAIAAIKSMGKNSLGPLNLLGKCLLKRRDFGAAARILDQARQISPDNIARLLALADVHLLDHQPDKASALVDQARAVDPTNPQLPPIALRAAIMGGKTKSACELIASMESLHETVAYMNNRAVSLAHVGRFEEAVGLYEATLASLPATHKNVVPTVTYNLALCLTRADMKERAMKVLDHVVGSSEPGLRAKAASLADKLRLAIERKVKINFAAVDPGAPSGGGDVDHLFETFSEPFIADELAAAPKPRADVPNFCLAGTFHVTEPLDALTAGLLGANTNKVP